MKYLPKRSMIHLFSLLRDCAVIVMFGCLLASHSRTIRGDEKANSVEKDRVTVEVDFGDGSKKVYTAIPWKSKLTVFEAMESVAKHPRGIRFEHRGAGATAFLTQLDDQKNEGGGGRNWVFKINGKSADRSFGVRELDAGDTVLWKFEVYR